MLLQGKRMGTASVPLSQDWKKNGNGYIEEWAPGGANFHKDDGGYGDTITQMLKDKGITDGRGGQVIAFMALSPERQIGRSKRGRYWELWLCSAAMPDMCGRWLTCVEDDNSPRPLDERFVEMVMSCTEFHGMDASTMKGHLEKMRERNAEKTEQKKVSAREEFTEALKEIATADSTHPDKVTQAQMLGEKPSIVVPAGIQKPARGGKSKPESAPAPAPAIEPDDTPAPPPDEADELNR